MKPEKQSVQVEVKHGGYPGLAESTVTISRPRHSLNTSSDQRLHRIFDDEISAALAHLPEVAALKRSRAQLAGVQNEIPQISAAAQRAEADIQSLLDSDLQGQTLTSRVATAKEKQEAILHRLREAQTTENLLSENLATVEAAARSAILAHVKQVVLPRIKNEQRTATETARKQLQEAITPIMEELYLLHETDFLINASDNIVRGKIARALQVDVE